MRLLLSAMVLLLIAACAANGQQPVTVPGTQVSIVPPPGWIASDTFTGFQNNSLGASIVVTDMNGAPYSQTTAGFTKEAMAQRGMELISKSPATFGSYSGLFMVVRQVAGGETYAKWLVCFGDESRSVSVVATVKQALQDQVKNAAVTSIMSARIQTNATADQFAGLNFAVQAREPYKLAKRLQNTLLFTHKGQIPGPSPTSPLFVVGSSPGLPKITDQEAFAKNRAKQTETLTDINIYQSAKIALDELPGIQLMATATDTQTKTPMLLYQVILFDKDRYYLVQGIAEQKAQTEPPLWFEMVKSFKHKPGASAKSQ